MGAEPYEYVVDYQFNVKAALEKLRQEVFASGEYHGAELKPKTPQQALELAGADGTRSILDILKIAPEPKYCAAAPLTPDEYHRYFGTERPSLDTVRNSEDLWEELERGMARYALAYEGDRPTKIVFVGYSFD